MGSVKWVPGVSADRDDNFFFEDDVDTAIVPVASEVEPEDIAADPARPTFTERFSAWTSKRPFAGGLLMFLAGVVILTPAYMSFEVSNIQVQIATMSGVSTLLIGVLLMCCGLMTWFQPEGRLLAGCRRDHPRDRGHPHLELRRLHRRRPARAHRWGAGPVVGARR